MICSAALLVEADLTNQESSKNNGQVEFDSLRNEIRNLKELFSESKSKNEILIKNNKLLEEKIILLEHPIKQKNNVIFSELLVNTKSDRDEAKDPAQQDKHSILRTDVNGIAENPSTSKSSNVTVKETNQETNDTNKHSQDKSKALVAKNVADFFKNSETKNENTPRIVSPNIEWKTVSRKKTNVNRAKFITSSGPKSTTRTAKFSGALKKKWLYVGRIAGKDVPVESIREYLTEINGYEEIEIKKLESKGKNSSFSIGVLSNEIFERLNSEDFWPNGVIILFGIFF